MLYERYDPFLFFAKDVAHEGRVEYLVVGVVVLTLWRDDHGSLQQARSAAAIHIFLC